VKYVFQFGIVQDHLPELLHGALLTLQLSVGAFLLGFTLAVVLAFLRSAGPRPVRATVGATSSSSATRRSWSSSSSSTSRCRSSASAWRR
jgi:ABC-type amino acid transport system permease subunit